MRFAVFALLLWVVPMSALAANRVYEGDEAAALRCANTLALTAVALDSAGAISPAVKEVMLGVTLLILERHVSGTWADKKAALRVIRDRRDVLETLKDFERYAAQCLKQFPIN